MLNLEKVKEELNKLYFSYKINIVPEHSTYKVKWILLENTMNIITNEMKVSLKINKMVAGNP